MQINLAELSLKELKALQAKIEKEITGFGQRERDRALQALEEKAREMGFSLSELTGAAPARKRSLAAPKFANPENPSETWSGRGRKPRWYVEAVASGKTDEELSV